MKLRDFGALDGPVMVFGGPYSNLQATEALLEVARAQGIAPSHMICTGDVVAYGAQPNEVIAAMRASGCAVVAGNCEIQLASGAADCGCGFDEGSACDLLSAGWYAHASRLVGADDRRWMGTLPDMITFTHQGQQMAAIHGGLSDVSRFIWPEGSAGAMAEEVALIQDVAPQTSCVLAGHCGLAFQTRIGDVTWVNAGVIGMPPNDGQPDTRYAILRDGAVMVHHLRYDHAAARRAMEEAGLVQGYHSALTSGYWPSEEVLPPALRASG